MVDKNRTKELISSMSENMAAEEMMLSSLQALIAAEITMKRHELGMSQAKLAGLMGVSQTLVSKWESGETNFTLKTLVQIASILGIEMEMPFKMEAPLVYSNLPDKVIDIKRWKTSSSPSPRLSYTLQSDELLKEN